MPTQIFYTLSTTQDASGEVLPPSSPTIAADGSPGDPNTRIYTGALTIGAPTRIKAMSVRNAGLYSTINSVYYSKLALPPDQAQPVGYLPGKKTGPEGQVLSIKLQTATTGATIWYMVSAQLDILDPLDSSGSPVTGALSVANGGLVTITIPSRITARAIKTAAPAFTRSDLTTSAYTVLPVTDTLPGCTFTEPGGAGHINETRIVTIFNASPGVAIYYIVADSQIDPLDSNGNPIPGASGPISSGTQIMGVPHPSYVTARAILSGWKASPIKTVKYELLEC